MNSSILLIVVLAATQSQKWPDPPFDVLPRGPVTLVRASSAESAPVVGAIRAGARVMVTGCDPSCESEGWALLDGDGAVRLREMKLADIPRNVRATRVYATVRRDGADVYAKPNTDSEILTTEVGGDAFVFRPNEKLRRAGWMQRMDGGYVQIDQLKFHRASSLAGERKPTLPLAFLRKETPVMPYDGGFPYEWIAKHGRLPALGLDPGGNVRVEGGTVRRSSVRLAFQRARPPEVPEWARWVHVDLNEQVLTAYEGDEPVFATLVSTGARGRSTRLGVYQVSIKARARKMSSERYGYYIEEVPFTMFFHGGEALHAAYWHDSFGAPITHGCVNLSLEDAQWIFDWSPPTVPEGWNQVTPSVVGQESLWVVVDRAPMGTFPQMPASGLGNIARVELKFEPDVITADPLAQVGFRTSSETIDNQQNRMTSIGEGSAPLAPQPDERSQDRRDPTSTPGPLVGERREGRRG